MGIFTASGLQGFGFRVLLSEDAFKPISKTSYVVEGLTLVWMGIGFSGSVGTRPFEYAVGFDTLKSYRPLGEGRWSLGLGAADTRFLTCDMILQLKEETNTGQGFDSVSKGAVRVEEVLFSLQDRDWLLINFNSV